MGERDGAGRADSKPVELVELRFVRHVGRFVAKNFARINSAHLGATLPRKSFKLTHRHRGRVRTQYPILFSFDPKSVLHTSSRVVRRNVQTGEIVKIVFELGAMGDTKTHTAKNIRDFADGYRDWVQTAVLCCKRI